MRRRYLESQQVKYQVLTSLQIKGFVTALSTKIFRGLIPSPQTCTFSCYTKISPWGICSKSSMNITNQSQQSLIKEISISIKQRAKVVYLSGTTLVLESLTESKCPTASKVHV